MTPSSAKSETSKARRAFEVDMSPEAIDQRLRELGQLYELGKTFRDVRFLGPVASKHTLDELHKMISDYEAKTGDSHLPDVNSAAPADKS
jgi:hypothetical protein